MADYNERDRRRKTERGAAVRRGEKNFTKIVAFTEFKYTLAPF
jgi:hypothetical protein